MGRFITHIDGIMLTTVVVIAGFGLFLLLSIRNDLFFTQAALLGVGIVAALVIARMDGIAIQYFSPYLYIGSIILLVLTYFSHDIRGASRWLDIGPVQIQPSEIIKPFLLVFFANIMAQFSPRKIRNLPIHIVLFALPFFLIFKQPDLGSAIVLFSFWIGMLFVSGVPFALLFGAGALFGVLAPVLWNFLAPFQKLRIITFLDPAFDPQGAGYNAFQAMIAVGSGQLFGRGLGRGTQSHLRFLPEFHTDFIFATLIEELGFVGGAILLALYGFLLWRLIRPFLRITAHEDVFHLYAVGLFGMLLTQIVINTGMNMGIIPITGITLPLVSYGGSSLVSLCVAFGILWALKGSAHVLSR